MRQAISLTGLDTHKFKCAMEGVLAIHSLFAKETGGVNTILPWQPGYYQGHPTIETANRYFTSTSTPTDSLPAPFHPQVDLKGILSAIVNEGQFMHTLNNHVRYVERVEKDGGGYK
jgi:hypothetical protein